MRRQTWLLLIAAAVSLHTATAAEAQETGVISGRTWSAEGATLEAATVRLLLAANQEVVVAGTISDRLGYFVIDAVAPGDYVLAATRLGATEERIDVRVTEGERVEVTLVLATSPVELEGLVVEGRRSRVRERFEQDAGATVQDISRAEIQAVPSILEPDPIRVVEVLPGVTTVSDFTAAFNVRGGSADQNLILLDGVPVFNPFHLGGFFSVFNADMVERAELMSGGFPAEYGGRASSVLTVESDAGAGAWAVDAGVSLLASRAAVGAALPSAVEDRLGLANSRWRLSGRRTYVDVLAKPWVDIPYALTDLQGVLETWSKGGNRLRVSGYTGRDRFDLSVLDDLDGPSLIWSWGNDVVGGSWTHPRPGGGSLDVRGSYSRFNADLNFVDIPGTFIRTNVAQLGFAADLERRPTPRTRWKSGLAANCLEVDNEFRGAGAVFYESQATGWEGAGYSQIGWQPNSSWLVDFGARLDHWRAGAGGTAMTFSPRLAVKRFLFDGRTAVRLATGRYSQFVHSRRNEELPVGIDVWVLTDGNIPRMISDQVQLAVERFVGPNDDWFASLEGYYRTFDGVIAINPADDPNIADDDHVVGTGRSYGVDLYVRREIGATTGWLSASWLKTDRTFPDTRSGRAPPPDLTYAPVFDRRLDLDLVLRRDLEWWGVEAGLRFNFGTGLPYTMPLGDFDVLQPDPIKGMLSREGEEAVLLGPRNGARYPGRHRLDVNFRKTIVRDWGRMTPYLNIINLYNQKNVLFYFYEYRATPPERTSISMIPIVPTLGIDVSF